MGSVVRPITGSLRGTLAVPGDKSISHRAVLFAAMAQGTSYLSGLLDSDDVRATIRAVRALGARADDSGGKGDLALTGWGSAGPRNPNDPIDCGNSGTTARLLAGALAGWDVAVTLVGDPSLSRRPMTRVTEPLALMGASFKTAQAGTLPMTVRGSGLVGMEHTIPVASAQVKTALLLAGTRASGRTAVTEPARSRDHTERMLPAFGVSVERSGDLLTASVEGSVILRARDVAVPSDPSSAAFFVVAALLVPRSRITLTGVSLNPTRCGAVEVLRRMGADIVVSRTGSAAGEDRGDLTVSAGVRLHGVTVAPSEVPSLIDEIPVLAVAAAFADGVTRFEGVSELRVKESDRLAAVAEALTALGAQAEVGNDWLEVRGPARLRSAELDSLGDHRLAMAYHVAGLAGDGLVSIERYEAISVSYPGFRDDMESLAVGSADGG